MSEQYGQFAYIYDELMKDVNYEQWVEYIEDLIKKHGSRVNSILEVACGTGNITIPLAKKGYEIEGLDISQDMLMLAKEKSVNENLDILFIQQDMVYMDLHKSYHCILSACDGINYIVGEDNLQQVFSNAYKSLKKDGIFIFDISSLYKIKNILGNNTFGENLEDITYLWENYYDDCQRIIEMDLSFFIKHGQYYKKREEYHVQKAYKIKEIIKGLEEANFKDIKTYSDFTFQPPNEKSQRIFFVAKR